MSDAPQVDLSQIRGDWHFHLNYLANAIRQSMVRAQKIWGEVQGEAGSPEVGELVTRLGDAWSRLEGTATGKDPIDITSPVVDEFLTLSTQTKAPCDALEEQQGLGGSASIHDAPLEHFTEALRQVRSFHDDLIMMREQKP